MHKCTRFKLKKKKLHKNSSVPWVKGQGRSTMSLLRVGTREVHSEPWRKIMISAITLFGLRFQRTKKVIWFIDDSS